MYLKKVFRSIDFVFFFNFRKASFFLFEIQTGEKSEFLTPKATQYWPTNLLSPSLTLKSKSSVFV